MKTNHNIVPFIDLAAQYNMLKDEIDDAVHSVFRSGIYHGGPELENFERTIAKFLSCSFAVGVASGTDALLLSILALGIGEGDEVIVPAYSFLSSVDVVIRAKAKPIFVDIDPQTYCLDTAQVAGKISNRTRAILPVHLYGHPSQMDSVCEIARDYELLVIEDNAQAFGAKFDGEYSGSIGHAGCNSFYATKILGGCGDGGVVFTNLDTVAEQVKLLRNSGSKIKYFPEVLGFNSMLDEVQAAILNIKLNHIPEWIRNRRAIAKYYSQELQGTDIIVPFEADDVYHSYNYFVIRSQSRDALRQFLMNKGIQTEIYYPQPLHLVKTYKDYLTSLPSCPNAELMSRENLALPLFPEMSDRQVEYVLSSIKEFQGLKFRKYPEKTHAY